jgi:hypothetical protein
VAISKLLGELSRFSAILYQIALAMTLRTTIVMPAQAGIHDFFCQFKPQQ